jgi:hypothetical protein
LAPLIEKYKISHEKNFVRAVMNSVAENYKQPLVGWPNLRFPEKQRLAKQQLTKPADLFWALNDFSSQIVQIEDPFLIFASLKDPIVPVDLNIGRIWNREYGEVPTNIQVARLKESYHCSLPVTYDWQSFGRLIRQFVIKHSSEFCLGEKSMSVKLSNKVDTSSLIFKVSSEYPSRETFSVALQSLDGNQVGQFSLNLSELGFQPDPAFSAWSQPRRKAYHSMLQRWVNANLSINVTEDSSSATISWMSPR